MQGFHFHFCTAFLNAELNKELYTCRIPGFGVTNNKGAVLKLHKSLYGLHQSTRMWNFCLKEALTWLGFIQAKADLCLFF